MLAHLLQMFVWRRKPDSLGTVHSGKSSQFTSRELHLFFSQHNFEGMSQRENCHENAVAESFVQLLKWE